MARERDSPATVGIHAGDAGREAGDFFDGEANYAARVAGCAVGGEIVVSGAVRDRVYGKFVLGDPAP